MSGSRFARPVEYAALALALGVAVLVWALTRTYPNYDSYYHLVWGRQLLDGLEPTFTAYAAPTQHPLYVALLVLAFRRLLRGARGNPVRAALAAGFAALVLHTWMYAAFLEDPVTWTLLALGTALAFGPGTAEEPGEDAAAALNGHRREPVVVARSAPS